MARAFLLLLLLPLGGCSGPVFHDLEGTEIALDQFGDRWLVINYWAIWCNPCRAEIPELNALAQREHERVALLAVNFDLPPLAQLTEQARALAIEFPVLVEDPAEALGYARPEVLPTTILITPDGQVAGALEGPQTATSILRAIDRF